MQGRRVRIQTHKDPNVNHALVGQEAALSFNDDLVERWCTEDVGCRPPRLCMDDLEEPERFRQRLEAWIRTQC